MQTKDKDAVEALSKKVEVFIQERRAVPFFELERVFEGFTGDYTIRSPRIHEMVYWAGLSKLGIAVLIELLSQGRIFVMPADPRTYAEQGEALALPCLDDEQIMSFIDELAATGEVKLSQDAWLPTLLVSPDEYFKSKLAAVEAEMEKGRGVYTLH